MTALKAIGSQIVIQLSFEVFRGYGAITVSYE